MTTSTAPATLTGTYRIDPAHGRTGFLGRHAVRAKARVPFNESAAPAPSTSKSRHVRASRSRSRRRVQNIVSQEASCPRIS